MAAGRPQRWQVHRRCNHWLSISRLALREHDRLETKECQKAESLQEWTHCILALTVQLQKIGLHKLAFASFAFFWWWRDLGAEVCEIFMSYSGMLYDTASYMISDSWLICWLLTGWHGLEFTSDFNLLYMQECCGSLSMMNYSVRVTPAASSMKSEKKPGCHYLAFPYHRD